MFCDLVIIIFVSSYTLTEQEDYISHVLIFFPAGKMESTLLHILTIFMIFLANCHGVPIKYKITDKLSTVSEEALPVHTSNNVDTRLLSSVKFRSRRSSGCEEVDISRPLNEKLRTKSGSSHVKEKKCTCKNLQKYDQTTVCYWNSTCLAELELCVRWGCL